MRSIGSVKRLIPAGVIAGIALLLPYLVSQVLRWTMPSGAAVNWAVVLPGLLILSVIVAALAGRVLGTRHPPVVSLDMRVLGWSTVVLLAPLATGLLIVSIATRLPVENLLRYTQSYSECSTCGDAAWIAFTRYVQAVLLVSIADEVLFRGALYEILRRWMPDRLANILQALAGCIHYVWMGPFYFILGLYLNRVLPGAEHVHERVLVRMFQGTLTFLVISLSYSAMATEQGGTLALFCVSAVVTLTYGAVQKSTPWGFARSYRSE